MNIHSSHLAPGSKTSFLNDAGDIYAEQQQNTGIEYFSELIAKSNIDQVDIILCDGVTDIAKRHYAVGDWLDRWNADCREIAYSALTQCLVKGWSRSKLGTLDNLEKLKWHDVVLTRSGKTLNQDAALARRGGDEVQGYLYGRAMPASEISQKWVEWTCPQAKQAFSKRP